MLSDKQIARYAQHVKDGTWTAAVLDKLVKAGKLTQEEADQIVEAAA